MVGSVFPDKSDPRNWRGANGLAASQAPAGVMP
jgi:hypothetical protein